MAQQRDALVAQVWGDYRDVLARFGIENEADLGIAIEDVEKTPHVMRGLPDGRIVSGQFLDGRKGIVVIKDEQGSIRAFNSEDITDEEPKPAPVSVPARDGADDFPGIAKGILRSEGNGAWVSRGGLRYTSDDKIFGNRVRHVLYHASDDPERKRPHGVFDAGRSGALGVVDEAWAIAQGGGHRVAISTQGAKTIYTVDMRRRVGYVGGQPGAAAGHAAASHVRSILKGHDVITAYP